MGGENKLSSILVEGINKNTEIFKTHDEVLVLEASNGKRSIANSECFNVVSEKFKDPRINRPSKATFKTGVLINDARGNTFSNKNRSLEDSCMTQDNIAETCEKHVRKLSTGARINLFLFKEDGKYIFASVCVVSGIISVDYNDYEKAKLLLLTKNHRAFIKVKLVTE